MSEKLIDYSIELSNSVFSQWGPFSLEPLVVETNL